MPTKKQKKRYHTSKACREPNPYFLGFGNPNAGVIIFGQEKAISRNDWETINAESIQNPIQWKEVVDKKITNINYRFFSTGPFKNPFHPYNRASKPTNTWSYYQKLVDFIYPNRTKDNINNEFFRLAFITEINHEVSKKTMGNKRDKIRNIVTNHRFFRSFPITILATGNYLSKREIENKFHAYYSNERSDNLRNKKFSIYISRDMKRVIINTRQLSNFFFSQAELNDYLRKIAVVSKGFLR